MNIDSAKKTILDFIKEGHRVFSTEEFIARFVSLYRQNAYCPLDKIEEYLKENAQQLNLHFCGKLNYGYKISTYWAIQDWGSLRNTALTMIQCPLYSILVKFKYQNLEKETLANLLYFRETSNEPYQVDCIDDLIFKAIKTYDKTATRVIEINKNIESVAQIVKETDGGRPRSALCLIFANGEQLYLNIFTNRNYSQNIELYCSSIDPGRLCLAKGRSNLITVE